MSELAGAQLPAEAGQGTGLLLRFTLSNSTVSRQRADWRVSSSVNTGSEFMLVTSVSIRLCENLTVENISVKG